VLTPTVVEIKRAAYAHTIEQERNMLSSRTKLSLNMAGHKINRPPHR
jgi:hypothetical protein